MLFHKPFGDLEESDLQMLIDNNIREGKEVEYKEALVLHTDEQKQEFLHDVSSFANTEGGYLFYGIRERKEDAGNPLELCGLKGENPGKRIGDMEQIIQSGLDPRLYGISFVPVTLPFHDGRIAIVLSIPKSYASPHMVKSNGRFCSRNATGKFYLDRDQLQTAFALGETTAERIRAFRFERLSRIRSGYETPAPLGEQDAKLVLHVIPLNAFRSSNAFHLKTLHNGQNSIAGQLLKPLQVWDLESDPQMRFNIDGLVRVIRWRDPRVTGAYTQVFRNGIIESVDTTILGAYEKKLLSTDVFESKLLDGIKRYTELQKLLNIHPPFFIMVSLLNVKGYSITHKVFERRIQKISDQFDRDDLLLPDVLVEHFDDHIETLLQPLFDSVWNAAGEIGSPSYDGSGKFTPPR